jgi:hypothetical protein
MEIDTPGIHDTTEPQYVRELETLKRAKCELERRHGILVDQNRVLCEEAKQRGLERNQQLCDEVNKKLEEELHTVQSQNAEQEYNRILCENANQHLMEELQIAQVQHSKLEEIHFLCEQAKEKMQKELYSTQTQYTSLEKKHRSLFDLSKQLSDERDLLRKDRDDLSQELAVIPRAGVDRSLQPEPVPIEAGTVPIFEDLSSDDDMTGFDAQKISRWAAYTGERDVYELFVGLENDFDGCVMGRSFSVTSTEVASSIAAAKEHFSGTQLSAFTILGKRLPSLDPLYIFSVFSPTQRTIFLAPESVASKYIASTVISLVPGPDGLSSSVLTVASTAIVPWQRRKRRSREESIVFTKESITEHEIKVFTAGENREGNKRRLLQLKKRVVPD